MTHKEENVSIKRAITPEELDSVYRLRYHVYAEKMGYNFPKDNGPVIIESFDENAVIFYLEKNNEIIGTVRVNIFDLDKVSAELERTLAVSKFKGKYTEMLYTSRLILHPDHRSVTYLTLLCETVDSYAREQKLKLHLAECRPEMLPLYKFIGFKEYHEPFSDPIFGELIPLAFVADEQ